MRAAGWGVEFYPEAKKLGKQLQSADRRGFRVALVLGGDEFARGECQVKDLASGGSSSVPLTDDAAPILAEIRQIISP